MNEHVDTGGRRKLAIALMTGKTKLPRNSEFIPPNYEPTEKELADLSRYAGDAIMYGLLSEYKRAAGSKPSRAAHFKRQAKKRQNIRARGKK